MGLPSSTTTNKSGMARLISAHGDMTQKVLSRQGPTTSGFGRATFENCGARDEQRMVMGNCAPQSIAPILQCAQYGTIFLLQAGVALWISHQQGRDEKSCRLICFSYLYVSDIAII